MADANEAYITTVYNNSYQYFNTAVNGLVVKDTDSTYSGIVGTDGQIIVWDQNKWIAKNPSEIKGGFNYKEESYSGIIFNDGSSFYSINMSNNAAVNAVKWNSDTSRVDLIAMNDLHTINLASMVTGESYVIRTDGAGTYTVNAVPVLPGNTGALGQVYTGGATSNVFEVATPKNLMGLSETGKHIVVADPTASSWEVINLPPAAGDTEFYHLSVNSNGKYSYVQVVDSLTANGLNLSQDTTIATSANITSTATNLTAQVANYTVGLNYNFDVTFDIYVKDIIALIGDGSVTGKALIEKLPKITLKIGSEILGVYRVKTNQPVQTIHMSHVVYDVDTAPIITVEYSIPSSGYPTTPGNDFIQYIADSLIATMTPCGSDRPN